MFLSILFLFTIYIQQDNWILYQEREKVEISYKSHRCNDKKNGFDFEYYLIKIRNKTNETFVVNFYKGLEENEEQKIAFVLKPFEVKTGTCKYDPVKLRIFKSDYSLKNNKKGDDFNLTKIDIIEVY